jgi:hypothetical protein
MSNYSRERIEKTLSYMCIVGAEKEEFLKNLDRPEFVKKSGVIFCYRSRLGVWDVAIAGSNSKLVGKRIEYRRPNPQELGLDGKFSRTVGFMSSREYNEAIDHCNKLMGWDSESLWERLT